MPPRERQRLITKIVSSVLSEPAEISKRFNWLPNKHLHENFRAFFPLITNIFKQLGGDEAANQNKRTILLECDAYFGGSYNFIFEFDEKQHFSSARLKALSSYPDTVKLGFNLQQYLGLCKQHKIAADRYRSAKRTVDFDFAGGRTAQRAYLDCFKDLLPIAYGLKPTVRISEFEVIAVRENDSIGQLIIKRLLESKMKGQA